jgi:hypothetical protein
MRVELRVREGGVIELGTSRSADGRGVVYWWEWNFAADPARGIGGTWAWRYEPALGGTRFVVALLLESRGHARLTHGRIGLGAGAAGREPTRPWFLGNDSGNGTYGPLTAPGPTPHRLRSGFSWSVARIVEA